MQSLFYPFLKMRHCRKYQFSKMPHWCANAHMLICDVCLTANSPLKETRHFSVSFNSSAESATPPDSADDAGHIVGNFCFYRAYSTMRVSRIIVILILPG